MLKNAAFLNELVLLIKLLCIKCYLNILHFLSSDTIPTYYYAYFKSIFVAYLLCKYAYISYLVGEGCKF